MKLKGLVAAAFGGIISFGAMSTANADHHLGKEGTFSGQIGIVTLSENVMAMSENHVYITGKYAGTSTNSSGSGFLHNTAWACGGTLEIVDGVPTGIGYCTVTDQGMEIKFLDNGPVRMVWTTVINTLTSGVPENTKECSPTINLNSPLLGQLAPVTRFFGMEHIRSRKVTTCRRYTNRYPV